MDACVCRNGTPGYAKTETAIAARKPVGKPSCHALYSWNELKKPGTQPEPAEFHPGMTKTLAVADTRTYRSAEIIADALHLSGSTSAFIRYTPKHQIQGRRT